MSQSPGVSRPEPLPSPASLLGAPLVGDRVAEVLTLELSRHAGPKRGLIVGVGGADAVLRAVVGALLPGDDIAVVPEAGAADEVRAAVEEHGPWAASKITVLESLGEADPADVVIVAQPLRGTAEATRARLDELAKHLTEGGVLAVAVCAGPGLADGATAELERQQAFSGAGSDLVLRNRPPLRVHRLRYTPAPLSVLGRLAPARRPSSVPLSRSMNIDSNGVAAAGIALGLAAATKLARPKSKLWLAPAALALPVAAFFRDPQREVPEDEAAVVAASDGKVLSVERRRDTRFGDGEYLRVAVFLSVLDVHVNRAPVAGRVADYFVEDGGFAAAMKPEAEHNVAAYTVLDTAHGRVVVAQRTGLIARRIVQRAPVGAMLAKGERFGLIRFGSRTDVYLPAEAAEATVAAGDKVRGGATVIARWV
jgi:phosphatidylserine decarboxylase